MATGKGILVVGVDLRVFPKIGRKQPKWMVYKGKTLLELMIWGGKTPPYFWVDTHVAIFMEKKGGMGGEMGQ